ncbi:hypothetical protein BJ944DRAFT_263565 [Cunninghamella echinulata]|nr:hypothetical protein BJ944DRAFT_263565 [Cunninghamella echinulata]
MAPNTEKNIIQDEDNSIDKYVVYPDTKYPPLEPFEHKDPGHLADPKKASLYDSATSIKDVTPHIGTEIKGIQLSQLTEQQKNDLALLAAERGVVFFRDQDINKEQLIELGSYYGPLHIHNSSGQVPNHPELLSVFFDEKNQRIIKRLESKTAAEGIHSDITFEHQPAGLSILKIDVLPPVGGDTIWSSAYTAYDRLSKPLQQFLETLSATHYADQLIGVAKEFGHTIHREYPTDTVHPVIRTHPVTGWKGLFVQPGFTRSIVGLKKKESDTLLQLLYDHIASGYDFQVRFKWEEGSVAVWDNRSTFHAAIFDYFEQGRRFGYRVTPRAERPYFDPNSKSRKEDLEERRKANNL